MSCTGKELDFASEVFICPMVRAVTLHLITFGDLMGTYRGDRWPSHSVFSVLHGTLLLKAVYEMSHYLFMGYIIMTGCASLLASL